MACILVAGNGPRWQEWLFHSAGLISSLKLFSDKNEQDSDISVHFCDTEGFSVLLMPFD